METQIEAVPMVEQALAKFSPTDAKIAELREQYKDLRINGLSDRIGFEMVHESRMTVKSYRVAVEKTRVALKADALDFGRRVDGEAKRLTALLEMIEGPLERMENDVLAEKARIAAEAAAKLEAARKVKLDDRIAKIQQYGKVTAQVSVIEAMSDEQFAAALEATRQAFEENKAAEAKLAEQRAAQEAADALHRQQIEAAEREARRIEAERLASERAAFQAQQAAAQASAREEQAKLDAQREAQAAESSRLAAAQKKLDDASAAAAKSKAAKEAAKRRAALEPELEQCRAFAATLRALEIPNVSMADTLKSIVEQAAHNVEVFLENQPF